MDWQRALERVSIFLFLLLAAALFGFAVVSPAQATRPILDANIQVYAFSMPDDGWAPLRVYFSAYESRSPNGRIVRYEWDLDGDGAFESDATQSGGYVSQLYTKPGRRTVSVRVMDEQGRYNTASAEIEIRHPAASSVDYWTIFDQDEVKRIDLILTQANWDAMWANPPSKTEVPADAILFGQQVEDIGLSMKGNGSLGGGGAKKSWKLDFNAYYPEQEFKNLKMLLLQNNFGDASMLREKMAYDMAQFAGVAAAFTSYVEVWIDIEDDDQPAEFWGVYTLVEHPDRKYLANRFGRGNDTGNLYKADSWFDQGAADLVYYGPDIQNYPMPRGRVAYRLMTNEDAPDYTDVINLCYVIDGVDYESPEAWGQAVEQVLNVDGFLRYMAVIWLNLNLDTYPYTGNNFYLYDNPGTGRFEWIAWDMNNSWGHFGGEATFPLYGQEQSIGPVQYAPLFVKVFQVEDYRRAYRAYVDLLIRNWFNGETLGARARAWHDLIDPYIRQGQGDKAYFGPDALYTIEAFESDMQELVNLTRNRADYIRQALIEEQQSGD